MHGSSHGPASGSAASRHRDRLAGALGLTITYMAAAVVVGLLARNLALLADAVHV